MPDDPLGLQSNPLFKAAGELNPEKAAGRIRGAEGFASNVSGKFQDFVKATRRNLGIDKPPKFLTRAEQEKSLNSMGYTADKGGNIHKKKGK